MRRRFQASVLGLVVLSGVVAWADTLVLRNGNRVEGRLLSIRDGVVEFEEGRGARGRVVRVDQDEIRTIEFDRGGGGNGFGSGGGFGGGQGGGGLDGRPSGLREREVNVSARTAWTDTGISVRGGQTIYFDASGRVRWGPGRQDGPEGEDNSPRNAGRPIPARPAAALIGRIGDDAPFFIGASSEGIRVRGSGTLFLGVNDDFLDDNTGSLRVTVRY